eukprot:TRINITY_DN4573_c0_g2_i1.p1 TRINITY_DN4573_c0_g2~~TRINITY_DN4573_c0_g2_i1.p1  ORF type:complete len:1167 (-),score=64.00 TRINITY_DN4573_c0_g2_i1:3196-6696(-)
MATTHHCDWRDCRNSADFYCTVCNTILCTPCGRVFCRTRHRRQALHPLSRPQYLYSPELSLTSLDISPSDFIVRQRLGGGEYGDAMIAYDARRQCDVCIKVAKPAQPTPFRNKKIAREASVAVYVARSGLSLHTSRVRHVFFPLAAANPPANTTHMVMDLAPITLEDVYRGWYHAAPFPVPRWIYLRDPAKAAMLAQLASVIAARHDLTLRMIFREVTHSLLALRRGAIEHRDVKPENFLLDVGPPPPDVADEFQRLGIPCGVTVQIADFGLARGFVYDPKTPQWLGTYPYRAPELQFEDAHRRTVVYDYSADMWSVGVIFAEFYHAIAPARPRVVAPGLTSAPAAPGSDAACTDAVDGARRPRPPWMAAARGAAADANDTNPARRRSVDETDGRGNSHDRGRRGSTEGSGGRAGAYGVPDPQEPLVRQRFLFSVKHERSLNIAVVSHLQLAPPPSMRDFDRWIAPACLDPADEEGGRQLRLRLLRHHYLSHIREHILDRECSAAAAAAGLQAHQPHHRSPITDDRFYHMYLEVQQASLPSAPSTVEGLLAAFPEQDTSGLPPAEAAHRRHARSLRVLRRSLPTAPTDLLRLLARMLQLVPYHRADAEAVVCDPYFDPLPLGGVGCCAIAAAPPPQLLTPVMAAPPSSLRAAARAAVVAAMIRQPAIFQNTGADAVMAAGGAGIAGAHTATPDPQQANVLAAAWERAIVAAARAGVQVPPGAPLYERLAEAIASVSRDIAAPLDDDDEPASQRGMESLCRIIGRGFWTPVGVGRYQDGFDHLVQYPAYPLRLKVAGADAIYAKFLVYFAAVDVQSRGILEQPPFCLPHAVSPYYYDHTTMLDERTVEAGADSSSGVKGVPPWPSTIDYRIPYLPASPVSASPPEPRHEAPPPPNPQPTPVAGTPDASPVVSSSGLTTTATRDPTARPAPNQQVVARAVSDISVTGGPDASPPSMMSPQTDSVSDAHKLSSMAQLASAAADGSSKQRAHTSLEDPPVVRTGLGSFGPADSLRLLSMSSKSSQAPSAREPAAATRSVRPAAPGEAGSRAAQRAPPGAASGGGFGDAAPPVQAVYGRDEGAGGSMLVDLDDPMQQPADRLGLVPYAVSAHEPMPLYHSTAGVAGGTAAAAMQESSGGRGRRRRPAVLMDGFDDFDDGNGRIETEGESYL